MDLGDKLLQLNTKYQQQFTDIDDKKLDRGGQIYLLQLKAY